MEKIRKYAFYLLGRREYSVAELRSKLQKKTTDSAAVEALLSQLQADKYCSDERFCRAFIRDQVLKKQGPFKIKQKLLLKGIESVMADEFIASDYSSEDQRDIAKYLYEKKQNSLQKRKGLSDRDIHDRVVRFLVGRGFGFSVMPDFKD